MVREGGCEGRLEVFYENLKKKKIFFWGGGGGGGSVGGPGWGVRVDVNEKLKFWGKIQKKKIGGGGGLGQGGGGWGGEGVGVGGGGGSGSGWM